MCLFKTVLDRKVQANWNSFDCFGKIVGHISVTKNSDKMHRLGTKAGKGFTLETHNLTECWMGSITSLLLPTFQSHTSHSCSEGPNQFTGPVNLTKCCLMLSVTLMMSSLVNLITFYRKNIVMEFDNPGLKP